MNNYAWIQQYFWTLETLVFYFFFTSTMWNDSQLIVNMAKVTAKKGWKFAEVYLNASVEILCSPLSSPEILHCRPLAPFSGSLSADTSGSRTTLFDEYDGRSSYGSSPIHSVVSSPLDHSIASSLYNGTMPSVSSTDTCPSPNNFHGGSRIPLHFQRMRQSVVNTMKMFPRNTTLSNNQLHQTVSILEAWIRQEIAYNFKDNEVMLCLYLVKLRTLHPIAYKNNTEQNTIVDYSSLINLHCFLFANIDKLPIKFVAVQDYIYETGVAFQDELWPYLPNAIVELVQKCEYNDNSLTAVNALKFEIICNSAYSGDESFDANDLAQKLLCLKQVASTRLLCGALCSLMAMTSLAPEICNEIVARMNNSWATSHDMLPHTLRGYAM